MQILQADLWNLQMIFMLEISSAMDVNGSDFDGNLDKLRKATWRKTAKLSVLELTKRQRIVTEVMNSHLSCVLFAYVTSLREGGRPIYGQSVQLQRSYDLERKVGTRNRKI